MAVNIQGMTLSLLSNSIWKNFHEEEKGEDCTCNIINYRSCYIYFGLGPQMKKGMANNHPNTEHNYNSMVISSNQ